MSLAEPLTGRLAEAALHQLVLDRCVDDTVLKYVLPQGRPHEFECVLWDYKRQLPDTSGRADGDAKLAASAEIAQLVKDVVAFHNAYGGFIVAGVDQFGDDPVCGCDNLGARGFTIDKFNEQLEAYTKTRIDCRFASLPVEVGDKEVKVGLLLVPMRPSGASVVRVIKAAPIAPSGSAFEKNTIFARIDDKCMPVQNDAQGLRFVCSSRRLHAPQVSAGLENNLPARDPNIIRFVGRADYLLQLWSWLIERHAPVKVLSALGGTGKTAIAFEFCTQLLSDPPEWLRKVVWLSAKRQTYSAVQGKYVSATRTDFGSIDEFFAALAAELGAMPEEIDAAVELDEKIELVLTGLREFPSLVVIDDLDTLELDQQNNLFSLVHSLAGQAFAGGSRFLFTSRLEFGADSQRIKVAGFDQKEFAEFATMTAGERGVTLAPAVMQHLYAASLGSPIFCSSILRLASLGMELHQAIKRWKGHEGEEVRKFAFERELEQLADSQMRTLFALCTLGETTQLELKQVLEVDDAELSRDLSKLREFHLFASKGDPRTGTKLEVPEPVMLMRDLIETRLSDPRRIEKQCARARSSVPRVRDNVASAIASVVALWREEDFDSAVMAAASSAKALKSSGDMHCVLGHCYLKVDPPKAREADKAFRQASDLGCNRPELLPGWFQAKRFLRDWNGIVDQASRAIASDIRGNAACILVEAMHDLGLQAVERGDRSRAIAWMKRSMSTANDAVAQMRAGDRLVELRQLCRVAAKRYVSLTDEQAVLAGDRLDVFNAVADAFDCHITETTLLELGIRSLRTWADDVFMRAPKDVQALHILDVKLGKLENMIEHISSQDMPRPILLERMRMVHADVERKWIAAQSRQHR